jgi:hypothetical protein
MAKRQRSLQVLFADTHGGYKYGLMPLGIELLDEHEQPWAPQPTEYQKWIGDIYTSGIDNVIHLAGKDPIDVEHVGDITHGNIFRDSELVSSRLSDHIAIGRENMLEWLKHRQVRHLGLVKGTGVHEAGQGTTTITIAEMLKLEFPKKNIKYYGHALLNNNGIVYDLAHHGPGTGIRKWLRGNVLRLYTRSLMMDDLMNGDDPPDVVARGHFHRYVPEAVHIRARGKTFVTRSFVLPSFTLPGDYVRKVAQSPRKVTVGMVVLEIIDGKIVAVYDQEPDFMRTIDLRTKAEVQE